MILRTTVLLLTVLSVTTYPLPEIHAQKKPGKLQIFILAGQSNMEGKGSAETMSRQLADPQKKGRFQHLKNGDQWAERDDVWIDYLGNRGQRHGLSLIHISEPTRPY